MNTEQIMALALNYAITLGKFKECTSDANKVFTEADKYLLQVAIEALVQEPAPKGKRFQTKFNVGDHAWYMKDNKPTEVVISAIEIFFVNTNQDLITYNAEDMVNSINWLDHPKLQEDWLFESKTELLESL